MRSRSGPGLSDGRREPAVVSRKRQGQNGGSPGKRGWQFRLDVLDLFGGRRHEDQELTPEFVATDFRWQFARRSRDLVGRRVQKADNEQDETVFKYWMAVLTLVHKKQ